MFVAVVAALARAPTACVPTPPGGGRRLPRHTPKVGGCQVFPADNAWNTPVDKLAVRSDSSTLVRTSPRPGHTNLHPDFGGDGQYGIPFKVVPSSQAKVRINYTAYGDESDPGPFPIPSNAPVEGGSASTGDRHVLVVQQGTCHLYELDDAFWRGDHWDADVGVNWNLGVEQAAPARLHVGRRRRLADPARPRAVRRGRGRRGQPRDCASRCRASQKGYIFPATHYASSSTDPSLPPMGLRLRLKASYQLVALPR